MKTTVVYFFLAIFFCACGDNNKIPKEYILETNSELNNNKGLKSIEDELENLQEFYYQLSDRQSSINKGMVIESGDKEIISGKEEGIAINYEKVSLKTALEKLFDPEISPCDLPKKVKSSLNKLSKKGKSWAPSYIVEHVKELPDSVYFVPRTSISALLHTVEIISENGTSRRFPLLRATSFANLDVERFMIKKGYNSFFYNLDCSGFLNAAIEGSGAIPGADIRTSARSALEKDNSMFIAGGVIISPLAAAYYGNALGTDLDTLERKELLKEIISIPDISDSDKIYVAVSYEAIWMSNVGSSSFNGEGSLGGNVHFGLGIGSLSASGNGGGSISRISNFSRFNTYFTGREVFEDIKPFTVNDIKMKLLTL